MQLPTHLPGKFQSLMNALVRKIKIKPANIASLDCLALDGTQDQNRVKSLKATFSLGNCIFILRDISIQEGIR